MGVLERAKAVMFAGIPLSADMFRYDFTKWVSTDSGNDIEVSINKVVIKKFKPNKWILHSPDVIKDATGSGNTAICAYASGARMKVSGIQALSSIFSGYADMTNNHGAGSDIPHCKGLCMYPYSTDGYLMMERMYTWEKCWSAEGVRDLSQVADWGGTDGFRLDGDGHGKYGITKDYDDKVVVPSSLYDFNTWARANNSVANSWYFGFGLYTNNTSALDADGYIDISSTPITIEIIATEGIDITSKEVWKLALGENIIYEKEKNVSNCWIKHGLASYHSGYGVKGNGYLQVDAESAKDYPVVRVPMVTDWMDYIKTSTSYISWNAKFKNDALWNAIREWYNTHDIKMSMLDNSYTASGNPSGKPSIFYNCGMEGEITLNINDTTIENGQTIPHQWLGANDAFHSSNIQKVNFNFRNGCRVSATHNMFRHADNLEEITTNNPMGATDCSGMFEFCAKLKTIPANMVDWSQMTGANNTSINTCNYGWLFEYSGVERVPIFNENGDIVADDDASRFNARNILVPILATQMFNGANSLTYFGPVINAVALTPDSANRMFGCDNIVDIRIKNLNHGDWHLDGGAQGNLSKLNSASVEYLFENLYNLNLHDELLVETDCTIPKVSTASLYCPSAWSDKISNTMVTNAKSKGWKVFVCGIEQ